MVQRFGLAGWGVASDDAVMSMRIRAAAESTFAVFGRPEDGTMFGIGPMVDVPAPDPIDPTKVVRAVIRRPGVSSR